MLEFASLFVVAVLGLFFVLLGLAALFFPARASRFLLGFAKTAKRHYAELAVRFIAGGALIFAAPQLPGTKILALFGWVLLVTTLVMLVIPWRKHQQFAHHSVTQAIKFIGIIGMCSTIIGVLLLTAVGTTIVR